MNRYIDCNENLVEVFMEVLEQRFPSFVNLNFKLLFDTKRRVRAGKCVLASIEATNAKIKFFSKDNIALDGYDFVIIVDLKVWELAQKVDKVRILSHELRHVFITEKGAPVLMGHEVEDFYQELELNHDDPAWKRNLAIQLEAIYDQEKEMKKKPKKGH